MQQVEVQRGRGVVKGNLCAGGEDSRRAGAVGQFEIAVAHQVQVAHRGFGSGGQHDVAVGVEVHQDGSVAAKRHAR